MESLIESIVQSDAANHLSSAQLQALIGLAGSTPLSLSPSHVLFKKLAGCFAQPPQSDDFVLSIKLSLLLCSEVSHRETIFAMVEAHSSTIDAVLTASVTSLSTVSPPRAASTEGRQERLSVLSLLTLLVLAAGGEKLKAVHLVELLGVSVENVISVLTIGYADVCGVVPGVAPVVSGALQECLVGRILHLLRELTFWTTYDDLCVQLGVATQSHKNTLKNTAETPLDVSAGPYRHHVGLIVSQLIKSGFLSYALVYLPQLIRSLADREQRPIPQIREHLLLYETLLTATDQFSTALRTTLLKGSVLDNVCAPLLLALTSTRPASKEAFALLSQCVDVTATLAFRSSESHRFWDRNTAMLIAMLNNIYSAAAELQTTTDERLFAELVAQLVRFAVNAFASASAPSLLQLWRDHLDEAGKQRVALRLRNPKSRRTPIDLASPAYDALRPAFKVASATTVVVAAQRGGPQNTAAPSVSHSRRGRSRSRSRGRGGGGHRGRSRSRGRGCARRGRPSRRQRLRMRYHVLTQLQQPCPVSDTEPQQLWDIAHAESSASDSGGSDDEEEEEAAGVVSAASLPDLSRWRRGPPPRSIPARYICSLSHALVHSSPVLSSTGYVFDRDTILDYLAYHKVCPVSGDPLTPSDLVIDTQLKEELDRVRDNFT